MEAFINHGDLKEILDFHDRHPEIRIVLSNSIHLRLLEITTNIFDSLLYKSSFSNGKSLNSPIKREIETSRRFSQYIEGIVERLLFISSYLKDLTQRDKSILTMYPNLISIIENDIYIKERALIEYSLPLLTTDIEQYHNFISRLLKIKKYKSIGLRIAFTYLKNFEELDGKLFDIEGFQKYTSDNIGEINGDYQVDLIKHIERSSDANITDIFILKLAPEKINNRLLAAYYRYISTGDIGAIQNLLSEELPNKDYELLQGFARYYINRDIAQMIDFVVSKSQVTELLDLGKVEKFYQIMIDPNSIIDYNDLNRNWLLSWHIIRQASRMKIDTLYFIVQILSNWITDENNFEEIRESLQMYLKEIGRR